MSNESKFRWINSLLKLFMRVMKDLSLHEDDQVNDSATQEALLLSHQEGQAAKRRARELLDEQIAFGLRYEETKKITNGSSSSTIAPPYKNERLDQVNDSEALLLSHQEEQAAKRLARELLDEQIAFGLRYEETKKITNGSSSSTTAPLYKDERLDQVNDLATQEALLLSHQEEQAAKRLARELLDEQIAFGLRYEETKKITNGSSSSTTAPLYKDERLDQVNDLATQEALLLSHQEEQAAKRLARELLDEQIAFGLRYEETKKITNDSSSSTTAPLYKDERLDQVNDSEALLLSHQEEQAAKRLARELLDEQIAFGLRYEETKKITNGSSSSTTAPLYKDERLDQVNDSATQEALLLSHQEEQAAKRLARELLDEQIAFGLRYEETKKITNGSSSSTTAPLYKDERLDQVNDSATQEALLLSHQEEQAAKRLARELLDEQIAFGLRYEETKKITNGSSSSTTAPLYKDERLDQVNDSATQEALLLSHQEEQAAKRLARELLDEQIAFGLRYEETKKITNGSSSSTTAQLYKDERLDQVNDSEALLLSHQEEQAAKRLARELLDEQIAFGLRYEETKKITNGSSSPTTAPLYKDERLDQVNDSATQEALLLSHQEEQAAKRLARELLVG
ncbi:hypothetical protein Bca4012_032912 [Brassica carinata]